MTSIALLYTAKIGASSDYMALFPHLLFHRKVGARLSKELTVSTLNVFATCQVRIVSHWHLQQITKVDLTRQVLVQP